VAVINPKQIIEREIITSEQELVHGPNSVDLKLKTVLRILGGLTVRADGSRDLPLVEEYKVGPLGYWQLRPGKVYQLLFEEHVDLPEDVCALTFLRSTFNRSGCVGSSSVFDSGYKGQVGITLATAGETRIEPGARVGQIVFMDAEAAHLYSGFYADGKDGLPRAKPLCP